MSQRDMLEGWRILVNGAATTAIEAANRATEAIIRHREDRSAQADQRVNDDLPGAETPPPAEPRSSAGDNVE